MTKAELRAELTELADALEAADADADYWNALYCEKLRRVAKAERTLVDLQNLLAEEEEF